MTTNRQVNLDVVVSNLNNALAMLKSAGLDNEQNTQILLNALRKHRNPEWVDNICDALTQLINATLLTQENFNLVIEFTEGNSFFLRMFSLLADSKLLTQDNIELVEEGKEVIVQGLDYLKQANLLTLQNANTIIDNSLSMGKADLDILLMLVKTNILTQTNFYTLMKLQSKDHFATSAKLLWDSEILNQATYDLLAAQVFDLSHDLNGVWVALTVAGLMNEKNFKSVMQVGYLAPEIHAMLNSYRVSTGWVLSQQQLNQILLSVGGRFLQQLEVKLNRLAEVASILEEQGINVSALSEGIQQLRQDLVAHNITHIADIAIRRDRGQAFHNSVASALQALHLNARP